MFSYLFPEFIVERSPENGGNISYKTFEDLEASFSKEVRSRFTELII
jgi:hypothetical protein